MTPEAPETIAPLCAVSDIPDPGARGFRVGRGPEAIDVLLVRHSGRMAAFVNRCPHRGVPLDWLPDSFLDEEGQLLVCATHGARFRPDTGTCVDGPCRGRSLSPFPVTIANGRVYPEPSG